MEKLLETTYFLFPKIFSSSSWKSLRPTCLMKDKIQKEKKLLRMFYRSDWPVMPSGGSEGSLDRRCAMEREKKISMIGSLNKFTIYPGPVFTNHSLERS